jgi:hypothetical protein
MHTGGASHTLWAPCPSKRAALRVDEEAVVSTVVTASPVDAWDLQLFLDNAAQLGVHHSQCFRLGMLLQKLLQTCTKQAVQSGR